MAILRDRDEGRSQDAHRGQGGRDGVAAGASAEAGEPDQAGGVVLGRAGRRGAVVGQVVLAQTELSPQPPEQRLIEQQGAGEGEEVPGPGVAPLDVRPLVRQGISQRSSSPVQRPAGRRITGRAQV